jgi:mannan endo-1,6-alpha-mannosidase
MKSTAKDMATDMMSFYNGDQRGQTPGLLPQPYYCMFHLGAILPLHT